MIRGKCLVDSRTDNADSFMREEESERDTVFSEPLYWMECLRVNSLFPDLERRISNMPEQNAEEEHAVNE